MVTAELAAVVGFALAVLLAWSPLLAVERVRALFAWPTRWLVVNYVVLGGAVVLVQCLSYVAVVAAVAGTGSVTGGEAAGVVGGVVGTNVLLPAAGAVGAVRLLPSRDVWSPDGEGLDGRIALGAGVVWYAVVTTVTFLVAGLALMFAHLPT
jgi:hypothetical protein